MAPFFCCILAALWMKIWAVGFERAKSPIRKNFSPHSSLEELVGIYGPSHRFTSSDICKIHEIWLGPI
jgi:hypothetical protein